MFDNAEKEIPLRLYKYQPDNIERVKQFIVDHTLYFSVPETFSDPFDSRICFDMSGTPREWNKRIKKLIKRFEPDIGENALDHKAGKWVREKRYENLIDMDIRNISSKMGIFCFTERNDNILMWTHYAKEHKGVCFEFLTDKSDIIFGTALNIVYKRNYPLYRYVDIDTKDVVLDLLRTKSVDWEYEKEWRVFAHPGWPISGPGKHAFSPSRLSGIIFGCRSEDIFKNEVRKMVADSVFPLKLYQAVESRTKFKLDIVPDGDINNR